MSELPRPGQRWEVEAGGHRHRVEAAGRFSRTVSWYLDDALVGTRRSTDEKIVIEPDDAALPREDGGPGTTPGVIVVRFTRVGTARRATWFGGDGDLDAKAQALLGRDGTDLIPEVGSAAARHEREVREHPTRYAARTVGAAVAKVILPPLLALLTIRVAFEIPWPGWDLPDIPWPDLPRIPWPDWRLPDLLPEWSIPGWLREAARLAKYVWPVLLAVVLARAEIRRRRAQDVRREARQAEDRPS